MVLLILPKLVEVLAPLGLAKFTMFSALNISPRNSLRIRSVIGAILACPGQSATFSFSKVLLTASDTVDLIVSPARRTCCEPAGLQATIPNAIDRKVPEPGTDSLRAGGVALAVLPYRRRG